MQKDHIKKLEDMLQKVNEAFLKLEIDKKQEQLDDLNHDLSQAGIWNDPMSAQAKTKKSVNLSNLISPWITLKTQIVDLIDLITVTSDDSLDTEFSNEIEALDSELTGLSKNLMFDGPYDKSGAIIRLTAGVGGTDAQDWTEMLERMYLRWAEKGDFDTTIIERSSGDEAGIKTSVIEVDGAFAYGKLRSEHGVHRLVRLSPFNSNNLRQTSFALVEVLPQIDDPEEVEIDEKDLKIDTYRSGGKGGQSVNTTDSAVRVTHLPTKISVAIQNERSQLQNKDMALNILKSKLTQLKMEQEAASINELRAGESANWGSQIRNYVMHPYTLVKDLRSKYEEHDVKAVLDGQIDGFIESYLLLNKRLH